MKAQCKIQYPILSGLLDLNDVVELEFLRYEKDTVLGYNGEWKWFGEDERMHREYVNDFDKPIIAEEGSYKGWRFLSKNGHWYDESCIRNFIGYKSLPDIFDRLEL